MSIQPKQTDVREFFERTIPDQIHLCTIDPSKNAPVTGRDFGADAPAAAAWAMERNNIGLNVYYSVNRVRDGVHKKPSRSNFVTVRFAHVDIDPPYGATAFTEVEKEAAYQTLKSADPCTIIWSGNGWQGLWRLNDGVSFGRVEEINRGLIQALGGDIGTHDISRLLRVPGLVNWPDAKKQAKGRVPALSGITVEDDGRVADAAQMTASYPAPAEQAKTTTSSAKAHWENPAKAGHWQFLTADDLGVPEDSLLRRMINEPKGEDRSRDALAMACVGLRYGLTRAQVMGVLLNPDNAVSAHCLDEAAPERAAERAIERALQEGDVMALFRGYERARDKRMASGDAEASNPTSKAQCKLWTLETMLTECVYIEDGSLIADTSRLGSVFSLADFRNSTAASAVVKELPGKSGSVRISKVLVANEWLAHPERTTVATRTFKAGDGPIVAAPDGREALNSWRGFRIGAAPDDWAKRAQPFVDHVGLLFGDDTTRFLDWTAHIAQKPGELPATAWLHISRKTGTGRNLIAKILGRVFTGYTALAFPLAATLKDGFNAALAGKVLAVVDEIDEGHSSRKHQMAQDLKQLVTEEVRTINQKFVSKYEEVNACRWLIFSNSPAALPLEDEDRRFNVVQYDGEPQKASYYSSLYAQAEDGGFIASVMQYLLQRDISGFNRGSRAVMSLAKAALLDRTRSQDDQTLRAIADRWPVDVITSGELREHLDGDNTKGAALRYALERAGIVRLRDWKESPTDYGRQKVTAYAVRNHGLWKAVNTEMLRKEINRLSRDEKDRALYRDT